MSRLISAFSAAEAVCRAFNIPIGDMVDVLGDVPTIEAVPVIRCKDCKHYTEEYSAYCACTLQGCDFGNIRAVEPDDFCSYGERKEEANDNHI